MRKVLIISDHLYLAGAERLIFELVSFCRKKNIEPTILIANNYSVEYYDSIYAEIGVKVVRTTLQNTRQLKDPRKIVKSLYWQRLLNKRASKIYDSVHTIGLYNAHKVYQLLKHPNRVFWHVSNAAQYFEHNYPFQPDLLQSDQDTIFCINEYQVSELHRNYPNLKAKVELFKLFINR